jgi:DNA-binding winged helix-turn-helix (wHTH) protein
MAKIYRFGPFRLDGGAEMLFYGDQPSGIGRRAVSLLRLLLERAGEPVSKEALIEAAWQGHAIGDSNLTVQIAALRRVFEEMAGGSAWIETLPRRGYRFVGPPITTEDSSEEPVQQSSPAFAVPDKPSVAVLPFLNLNNDPE